MAKVKFLGSSPIQTPESASVQVRASLGEEMTPIKFLARELCDGYQHIWNPGEEREVTCTCPDLRHIRQFLDNGMIEVSLTMNEKLQLAKLRRKGAA